MQFTTNVQLLLDGLNTVTRALSARPTKQILEGVHLSAAGEHVKLTCSDGNLSIEMSILADVKEEGTAVLPGRLFTELSRKLPGGEVTIRVSENHAASIRCLSSKSNLAGMNPTDYPEMARVSEGTTVRIPQDKLKEMISRVVFAIATEDNRQILTGCLLEVEPTEARLVALDGFRLAIQKAVMPFELPGGKENVRVVIPGRVLNEMSKVLGDTTVVCWAENAGSAYADLGTMALFGIPADSGIQEEDVSRTLALLAKGQACEFLEQTLLPTQHVYFLG
ncbi:MAG: DNA polymerase III subunit beta, partial [Clostridiales bacterium]|nr:DNA polymerase III subunit beta [Clostridiales bacterium]